MLPLLKLLAIGIKMCTEPLIIQVKNIAQVKAAGRIRFILIKIGGRIYYCENWINKRFLGVKEPAEIEAISEEDAVEKTLSFFFEVFILYGLFFYWAINETLDSIESSKQLKKDLDNLKESNSKLTGDIEVIYSDIEKVKKEFETIKKENCELKEALMISQIEIEKNKKTLYDEIIKKLRDQI